MTTTRSFGDIAFSDSVRAVQTRRGSRAMFARREAAGASRTEITPDLAAFIAEVDTAYLATASAAGQPYAQHRGGPRGFLRVLDKHTIGFADYAGNRQYITLGNLSENSKAFLFLMDYVNGRRVKVWGTARVVEGDAALQKQLGDPAYPGRVERAILFTVAAWDVNCQQHIHQRWSRRQIAPVIEQLQARITELESQIERLNAKDRMANS